MNTTDYCLAGEEWRDIPDYEGIYQASTFGRIRTVDGKQTHSLRHGVRTWKGRILKGRGDNPTTGRRVTLWKDKNSKDALVARLVGFSFLGVPEDSKMTINHMDGNRFNNHLDNLEWLSLADNIRHAFETDLMPTNEPINIKILEKVYSFNSKSKASEFIGRSHSYFSRNSRKRGMATTADGRLVEIV